MTSVASNSNEDPLRFAVNNFDAIRLVAAAEVAIRHSIVHLSGGIPRWIEWILMMVPGVPIFFFLSGYLISRSWERSPNARVYFRNRALRLFPGLWACIGASVLMLFLSGYLQSVLWSWPSMALWVVCQGSVVQFWNPEFVRGFGCGVVNGSLWSISVEIQFYVVTIILYRALRALPRSGFDIAVLVITIGMSLLNFWRMDIEAVLESLPHGVILAKAYDVTFLPWYFMFLLGVLAQRRWESIVPLFVQHRFALVALYVASLGIDAHVWGVPLGNQIPPYLVPVMGATVLALAYSPSDLTRRILQGNDVSYGLYIYHMPIVNLVRYTGFAGPGISISAALAGAALAAVVSWRFLERPFLRRKRSASPAGMVSLG
jgi:peptidoglycan/LPS O-acetylase OafA/YrhL